MTAPSGRPRRGPGEERVYRKQRLAAAARLFARYGFDEGAGGHITARDPERPDHFWINPFGLHFGLVNVSGLLLVDSAGTVVEGDGTVNPAGFVIHSQVHAARPDAVAAAHTHSVHGRAWSTLGRMLDPLTQDSCAFYGDHGVYDGFGGVVLESSLSRTTKITALRACDSVSPVMSLYNFTSAASWFCESAGGIAPGTGCPPSLGSFGAAC